MLSLREVISYSDDWENKMNIFLNEGVDFMNSQSLFSLFQSLEDCPLDEDEDAFQGLGEEDEEIDQFNDDTFGSGAIGK